MIASEVEGKRVVLHVDMDHFFSAVEEREHPEFKGNPVVVGADPKDGKGRGVVKTCNYEAREFGIYSGMPISRAWKLCPTAIYVRGNYPLYKEVSKGIMAILKKYSEKFQQWGFDEAFLEPSSGIDDFEEVTALAVSIKHEVLWSEKLTCSIGIAPNKLVAKIASDFRKPDGLTVVTEDRVERFLAPLPIRKMLWIGEKTERKLNLMGISTIGDLASYDVSTLVGKFGVMGRRFHQWAHGKYESTVGGRKGLRKSLGHESTFPENTDDQDLVLRKLSDLCQKVHNRATKGSLLYRTVTVKLRYEDFETVTHRTTLPLHTNCLGTLRRTARELAHQHLHPNKKMRLVGVRVSYIRSSKGQQFLL